MTAAKAVEYHITRQLMQRRAAGEQEREQVSAHWADRLIAVVAVTAGLFVLGSFLQELLWVALASATVIALGAGNINS